MSCSSHSLPHLTHDHHKPWTVSVIVSNQPSVSDPAMPQRLLLGWCESEGDFCHYVQQQNLQLLLPQSHHKMVATGFTWQKASVAAADSTYVGRVGGGAHSGHRGQQTHCLWPTAHGADCLLLLLAERWWRGPLRQ